MPQTVRITNFSKFAIDIRSAACRTSYVKTYLVRFKNGSEKNISAYGYTEDEFASRFYFHMQKDESDRKSFVEIKDVTAIIEIA